MVCVGVPWDAVLQSMLHAALASADVRPRPGPGQDSGDSSGPQRPAPRVLTLDVAAIVGTLAQRRSGYTPRAHLEQPLTGHLIGADSPRADPLDHTNLLQHYVRALESSRHVQVLVTTALVQPTHPEEDRFSREALYEEMFQGLAAAGYPRPWVVEAVQGYAGAASPLLEARARQVLYTLVNDFQNQGINEFRSVLEALRTWQLDSPDVVVVKHTGRYAFVDTLLLDVVEANPDVDLVVRLDEDGRAVFTGTMAVRGSLLRRAIELLDVVDMETQSINVETALWRALVQLCNRDAWPLAAGTPFPALPDCRAVYLPSLGVRARYESGGDAVW